MLMAAPTLTSRIPRDAAMPRLASSSVAPVCASVLSHTQFCVIPNANAYRFSLPLNAICSGGDR
jgi:hypothetical protein